MNELAVTQMNQSKTSVILFIAVLHSSTTIGQKINALKDSFRLEYSINQNGNIFKFWRGLQEGTKNRILIERSKNQTDTILFNDLVRDGIYKLKDVNHDGFKDFILYYHDYDAIYFFNKKRNNFNDTPVYMPMVTGIVDSSKNIYWGYRDAEYAEHFDYSILYTYINCKPFFYFKIIYKTAGENEGKSNALKIQLYKFVMGDYEKPLFIKEIKTTNPPKFDYRKYWKKNYRRLLGYH